jgi:DNA polymerase-1
MLHHVFAADADSYPHAILVKNSAFVVRELEQSYVRPLEGSGISREDLILCALPYNRNGKAPGPLVRESLEEIMPALASLGTRYLYCADAAYFKALTKSRKAEPHLGYVLPCTWPDCEQMQVVLGINHKSLIFNPNNEAKLTLSVETFIQAIQGTHREPGADIIHSAWYPSKPGQIREALASLYQYPVLAIDIETFSLHPYKAAVGTIAFAWDHHNGIAFACDYVPLAEPMDGMHGRFAPNEPVRRELKLFLENYPGETRWHNASFDLKVLIATLWMAHPKDYEGLLQGLEIVTARFHCTRLISYLALNSTADISLSLKNLAHSFAGNWAQEEIKDIRRIPLPELLQYNLVDCLSTNWVYDTYYPRMVADQQEALYRDLFLPSIRPIIQMELVGMPMHPEQIQTAKTQLLGIVDNHRQLLDSAPIIRELEELLSERAWIKDYQDRVGKAKHPEKIKRKERESFPRVAFNPGSGPQVQTLLYELMGLPVIDTTATRQPAVGADTLKKLINNTSDPQHLALIDALLGNAKAEKILSTFFPAFEAGLDKGDGRQWLHGSFTMGGTVSGRMSSSSPNLQQIPSGSTYGKLVKKIFQAPDGWVFCGADFWSLEDRINALVTGDPAKLAVYERGFDGHSLRTRYYWPQEFPEIDPDDPEQVNSLKDHPLRQKSKGPTFALTYLGTWQTLVNNAGFSEEEARAIEANYHQLYGVSRAWVQARIAKACQQGYAELAFGLRLRTPLLARSLLGKSSTPREAEAEARTLGNAISGQSFGLLNNRAMNATMERVWASDYRLDILPVAMIHDSCYFLVRDDLDALTWLNRVLIEEMSWQDLPELQHPVVKLGAELDVYYPSWADPLTLPNNATREQIHALSVAHLNKLKGKEAA